MTRYQVLEQLARCCQTHPMAALSVVAYLAGQTPDQVLEEALDFAQDAVREWGEPGPLDVLLTAERFGRPPAAK